MERPRDQNRWPGRRPAAIALVMAGPNMFPVVETRSPLQRMIGVVRANPGPLGLAALLVLASRISQIATYDPAVKGLTWAAVAEVALQVAAHALATLTGCLAVLSGGRPAGFRGLLALPSGRVGPFIGYAVLFNLLFLGLAAVLGRIAQVFVHDQPELTAALILAIVATLTWLLIYVQLGFLFPDITMTGQTSIMFSVALGLASARRLVAALAWPVAVLVLPQMFLAAYVLDAEDMGRAAATWPDLAELAGVALIAVLGSLGAAACAVAVTLLYQDLTQRLSQGTWR